MRARITHMLKRQRRGMVSMQAMLVLPVLLVVFGAVAQTTLLTQSRLHLEQAAYAAARAALVHKCPPFNLISLLKSPVAALRGTDCTDNPQAWEDAARWALVAAAPTSAFAAGRGACPDIRAGREVILGTGMVDGLDAAVTNALCYAYEPGNVEVTVEWEQDFLSLVTDAQRLPIRATVRFRYSLSTPFRRFVADGQRGDGTYWRWGSASVVLL
jgi:TPR repeat protein